MLTWEERRHLLHGWACQQGGLAVPDPPEGHRAAAKAWREHGAELTAEFIAEHPGSRPWAWWAFDAPEPRRRVGGQGEVIDPNGPGGLPACLTGTTWTDPPRFEAELTYLERLGLLTSGERGLFATYLPERLDAMRDPHVVHVTGPLPGQPGHAVLALAGEALDARRCIAEGKPLCERYIIHGVGDAPPSWPLQPGNGDGP